MTYQVKFTEITNPAKPPITVADRSLDTQTSLTFVGQNYAGYAPTIAENFLHLLENFAKNSAPPNPVEGQLWYDNSAGSNLLKVYDGTTWSAAGSVKKAATAPAVANSLPGDLWTDTDNQQLYIFSGSTWLLVGPQFSSGLKTGPDISTIVDTNNVSHSVISLYSEDYLIAIVSKGAFTPKATLTGFATIGQGINLSSIDAASSSAPNKFWGTSSQADALVVNGTAISSANFLRTDVTTPSNVPLSIRSNGGISIGSDLSFNIATDSTSTVLYSKTSGNSIDIKLNNAGAPTTVVHIDANTRVGIGPNNTTPRETLDILGNIITSGNILVDSTLDSTSLGVGSISTTGGLSIALKSNFGDDISTAGQLFVNYLDSNGDPTPASVILPGSDSANNIYDIGSVTRKFRNVFAESFVGNFSGTFTGSLSGSITGKAAALLSPTAFSLTGDVISDVVSFDGQTTTGTAIFATTISQDLIALKPRVTDSLLADDLLVYRSSGLSTGLKKISKQTFISNIPTVPIASILTFAGGTPPSGYLLCDGGEIVISEYAELWGIIGYSYKPASLLVGSNTFALPDLRGRFALGRDNMDNTTTVPSRDDGTILVDAGGGSANRVTDVTADIVGAGSGNEQRTLLLTNLPDHKHNLNSGVAQYYASGLPGAGTDPNAVPNTGMPNTSTGSGLPNSGNIIASNTGVPFNSMNPYLTINYIIYTGVVL
jgi:microcystin-dependent protein